MSFGPKTLDATDSFVEYHRIRPRRVTLPRLIPIL